MENRRVVLTQRPEGIVDASNFEVETVPLGPLGEGDIRVQVSHVSVDAFIRTTLGDAGGFHGRAGLREPVMALGVGKVVESTAEGYSVGDWVAGATMAQSVAQGPAAGFQKIEPGNQSPSLFLGLLGMTTGLTAYAGMCRVGEVAAGETVVVSGAAGAVGTVACQLAKHSGAKVIGIAGGEAKTRWLTETIGIDGAVDYKAGDVGGQLDALVPDGIDVFFDNVGGEILDDALDRIRMGARVVLCGAISQYSDLGDVRGPKLYLRIAERNASMRGFTVDHYASEFPAYSAQILEWMDAGLQLPEQIEEGIDAFPEALHKMFVGGHMGKLLVRPADAP